MLLVNYLAQLWGFSLIVVSLAFLVNPKNTKTIFRLAEDEKILFLVGIINVILGVALVLAYNIWASNWKTIITIIGWLVVIRGCLILFLPDFVKEMVEKVKRNTDWIPPVFVVCVLLGCFLVYMGFVG